MLQHKYGVHLNETGQRYLALLAQCNALGITTWETYRATSDGTLRLLQTELERYADFLTDLMSVDGALVLNQEFEVVGFGTEIQVPANTQPQVYRALDRDVDNRQAEPMNGGGTRHRAAYRLCQAATDYLVIVVSQDSSVKLRASARGAGCILGAIALNDYEVVQRLRALIGVIKVVNQKINFEYRLLLTTDAC